MMDRLREGRPPLRVNEFAELAGYSCPTIRKLIVHGAIKAVGLAGTAERRIPVDEARRILTDLRVLTA